MNAIEQIQAILDFLLLVKTGLFSDVAKIVEALLWQS